MTRSALAALLLLTACARSEEASVVADANETAVERVRTPERDEEEEIAIGEWRDTIQGDFAALEFGPMGAPPLFSLRCDERRSVLLQRHGTVPASDLPTMLVSVGSETRRLAVTNVGGVVPMLRASLAPSDEFIETLAGAAEPVIIRIGDSPPLVLPPSPSIGGFLARCGSGTRAPVAVDQAEESNAADAEATAPDETAPEGR